MLNNINDYLNLPASFMLTELPYSAWHVEKSFENALGQPIIHYLFPVNGLELRCDSEDKVNTIFLYSNELGGFDDRCNELSFSLSRQQVLDRLGTPSKSGDGIKDPILGEYGPWDRFSIAEYSIHIEYSAGVDRIKKITLMHANVTP
jgi:hypothetical protein